MKLLHLVFSILILGLTGCAPGHYRHVEVGYSGGYSDPYEYAYPVQTYYEPARVIYREQYYSMPSHHDRHGRHDAGHGHWDKKSHSGDRDHHAHFDRQAPGRHEPRNGGQRAQREREQGGRNDSMVKVSRHTAVLPRGFGGDSDKAQRQAESGAGREHHRHRQH